MQRSRRGCASDRVRSLIRAVRSIRHRASGARDGRRCCLHVWTAPSLRPLRWWERAVESPRGKRVTGPSGPRRCWRRFFMPLLWTTRPWKRSSRQSTATSPTDSSRSSAVWALASPLTFSSASSRPMHENSAAFGQPLRACLLRIGRNKPSSQRTDHLSMRHALSRAPSTLYVVVASELQQHLAPIIAGVIRDMRSTAYAAAAADGLPGTGARDRVPVLLVLDELANIAPLHDLPTLVAEGGSQGVVTLACLQDLSQARAMGWRS